MSSLQKSPSAMSAAMREVKLALGELFSGGQLDPSQVVMVHVLFGFLGLLARADGIVTHDEAEFVNTLMDELHLPSKGRKLGLEAFAEGSQRKIDIDQELHRFLSTYPRGSKEAERLYDSLLKLAAADGKIRPGEKIFLEKITVGLGYPPATLGVRLQALVKGFV
jgi:DnaJ like chaperone protein